MPSRWRASGQRGTLRRRVDAFTAALGRNLADLNHVRSELQELSRVSDGLDNPPLRVLAIRSLGEIVASAKESGIDTSEIERSVDFEAAGIASFRLELAGLRKPERVDRMMEMLIQGGERPSRLVAQALANEMPEALPALSAKLANILARRDDYPETAPIGLLMAVQFTCDARHLPLVAPFLEDRHPGVKRTAKDTVWFLERGVPDVPSPEW